MSKDTYLAVLTAGGIVVHLCLRYLTQAPQWTALLPLFLALVVGGGSLLVVLTKRLWAKEFGSDLLAGISIISSVLLGQYLVGTIIVLMLTGGSALEEFATRRASSVLDALAKRMPQVGHRKQGAVIEDVQLGVLRVGDRLIVFPHEICPVDGAVIEGHGVMDESYLTGEPFEISKAPGSKVLSGAINGDAALTIEAEKLAVDSRYAKIMQVMQQTQEQATAICGASETVSAHGIHPVAVGIAGLTWLVTGDAMRFLAVVVVATPCPLILAIPVAVIGAISLSAKYGIIIKNPAALEQLATCQHTHLRQDRDPDVWETRGNGNSLCPRIRPGGAVAVNREFGAIVQAPFGERSAAGGEPEEDSAAERRRNE